MPPRGSGSSTFGKGQVFPVSDRRSPGKGKERWDGKRPYIIGLGKACELAKNHLDDENTRVRALRDYLEKKILETIPNVLVNGDGANRLPNTVSVSFEYVEGESILLLLSDLGICASSGSACTSVPWSHRMCSGPWACLLQRPTVDSVQPVDLQYKGGDGLHHRASPADHQAIAGHLAVLERLH